MPRSPRRSTDCWMTRQRSNSPLSALCGAILTIDLGAIRENYRILKGKLGGVPAAKIVKSASLVSAASVVLIKAVITN